ncbi:MAG: TIGR00159 family protein [Ruminococcaceae bacterium]|nr:TIGR00159 family protein [Oscillospiraceae bacterium]
MSGFLQNIWGTVQGYLHAFEFLDILDILITAFLIYQVLKLVQGTSAAGIIRGIVLLFVLYGVAYFAELNVIVFVLENVAQVGLLAVIIMFQPELRKMLDSLGRSKLTTILKREQAETDMRAMIREVVDACSSMSWSRTGALIVFERDKPLDEIVNAATEVDAKPTSELIKNIFFVKAPLHDGAMVMRDARIKAAGGVLPLTENEALPKELGTRHRASIGVTEHSDAVSVVVSEETGVISVAIGGAIRRNLSSEALENTLIRELIDYREKKDPTKIDMREKTRNLLGILKGKSE